VSASGYAEPSPVSNGIRAAIATALSCALSGLVAWSVARPLEDLNRQLVDGLAPPGGGTTDRMIVAAAALGLGGVTGGVLVLLGVNVAAVWLATLVPRLDAVAAAITPRAIRRAAFAVGGLALTAPGVSGVAVADDSPPPPCHGVESRPSLAGLPLPDLPTSRGLSTVTVEPGDSLWSIARRELATEAPTSAVATRVALLYAHNHRTIGANPDLIFPGQRLHAPGGAP
jgi:LysM domain